MVNETIRNEHGVNGYWWDETTIIQEINLPHGHIRLTKFETNSNVINRGSKYYVSVDNRKEFGLLDKCVVIYNCPFTQDGLEKCVEKFNQYLQLALNDSSLQEGN